MIAAHLRELVDARLAVIALLHDGMLRIEAAAGEEAEGLLGIELPLERSKGGAVLARKRSERVDSVVDDPEFDHTLSRRIGARTALIAPLLIQDRRLGVIAVCDRLGRNARFSDADLRMVEAFAGRAAIAVDLSQRVARESLQTMLHAQEEERKRFARELHDETGQALTGIVLALRRVREADTAEGFDDALDHVHGLAVSALEDVRRVAFELRPKSLDDFGLVAALERLVERVQAQSGLEIELETVLVSRLPENVETAVYRMVQEALTNSVRHSGAQRVSVVVAWREHMLSVLVEDDGRGFAPAEVMKGRFGLIAMQERLGLLSGWLDIESELGRGTTLRATIPIV
jgi:signal transduction histidine kinase